MKHRPKAIAINNSNAINLWIKASALSLALGALLVAANPAFADETRTYDFSDFTNIHISEGVDGYVTQGDGFSVTADAIDAKTLDTIEIEQTNNTLKIHNKDEGLIKNLAGWFSGKKPPRVHIQMPDITDAHVSAGADLYFDGFKTENFAANVSAGADLHAKNLDVQNIRASVSAGGDINLEGMCDSAIFTATAGSDLDAQKLECKSVEVEASSGGSATIFASETANANASSGGDVEIYGNPPNISKNASSGGDIKMND